MTLPSRRSSRGPFPTPVMAAEAGLLCFVSRFPGLDRAGSPAITPRARDSGRLSRWTGARPHAARRRAAGSPAADLAHEGVASDLDAKTRAPRHTHGRHSSTAACARGLKRLPQARAPRTATGTFQPTTTQRGRGRSPRGSVKVACGARAHGGKGCLVRLGEHRDGSAGWCGTTRSRFAPPNGLFGALLGDPRRDVVGVESRPVSNARA